MKSSKMTFKERVAYLDKIDFLGTQEYISPAQREKAYKETVKFIQAHKKAAAKKKVNKAKKSKKVK